MKMRVKTLKKTLDNDEELQAQCLLEVSENEQWQEVVPLHQFRNRVAQQAATLKAAHKRDSEDIRQSCRSW